MGELRTESHEPPTASRRWFLLAAAVAVVAAGGGGVTAALRRAGPRDQDSVHVMPAVFVAALQAEDHLIASIDALGAPANLAHLRADHVQHRTAIAAAAAEAAGGPIPALTPAGVTPKLTLPQLLAAEQAAATAAAIAANQLTGAHAVLLASISACEASHAELLR